MSSDDLDAASATFREEQRRAFGAELRRLRTETGLTLKALAKKANVSRSSLSTLELGQYRWPSSPLIQAHINTCLGELKCDEVLKAARLEHLKGEHALLDRAHQGGDSQASSTPRPAIEARRPADGASKGRGKRGGRSKGLTRQTEAMDWSVVQGYLDHMRERWKDLDLSILSVLSMPSGAATARRTMADQFVEPRLTPASGPHEPVPATAILERFEMSAILGEPGTGKSSLLQYLAWAVADGKGFSRQLVPFLIRVSDLASWDWDGDSDLFPVSYVVKDASVAGLALSSELVHRLLDAGVCLFLFDGLDEADPPIAAKLLTRLKNLIIAIRTRHGGNHVIMTSRPTEQEALADFELEIYRLDGFSWSDVELFARKWDRHTTVPAGRRQSLLASVRDPKVRRLLTRPLYLTVLARLHDGERGLVVEQRDDIFNRLIDHVLLRYRRKGAHHPDVAASARARLRLEQMALWMHRRPTETTDLPLSAAEMERRLARYLVEVEGLRPGEATDEAEAFLTWSVKRSGFVFLDGRTYAFRHPTIQQYLVSWALYRPVQDFDDPGESLVDVVLRQVNDPHWTEAILFLVSRLDRERATRVVAAVRSAPVEYEHLSRRNILMAVRIMAECREISREVMRDTLRSLWNELYAEALRPGEHRDSGSRRRVYRVALSLLPTLRGTDAEADMVDWLVDRMASTNPSAERARSCELLGTLGTGHERALEALFAALGGDEESTVQDNARQALAKICRFEENVATSLEKLAVDRSVDAAAARRHAGRALMQLHRRYDLTLQIGFEARSRSRGERYLREWLRAVREGMGDPCGTWADDRQAVTTIIDAMRHEQSWVRDLAAWVRQSAAGLVADEGEGAALLGVVRQSRSHPEVAPDPAYGSSVGGIYLGEVTKYWKQERAGVVSLVRPLECGAVLRVSSPDTRRRHGKPADFVQRVESMKVELDGVVVDVVKAHAGTSVSIKFTERVRLGDHVYVIDAEQSGRTGIRHRD